MKEKMKKKIEFILGEFANIVNKKKASALESLIASTFITLQQVEELESEKALEVELKTFLLKLFSKADENK